MSKTKTVKKDSAILDYLEKFYIPSSDEKIEVCEVWSDRYRINIRENNKIKASFFIRLNDGDVIYCNPPLVRV